MKNLSQYAIAKESIIERMVKVFEIYAAGKTRTVSVEYKRIKNMWMRLGDNGSLRISCSRYVSDAQIREFILSREKWILKAEAGAQRKEDICSYGADGADAMWLGKRLSVHCVRSASDYLSIDENGLTYHLRNDTDENRRRVFYNEASKRLLEMIRERRGANDRDICMANRKPLPKITIKFMTSRWGSCTPAKAHISISCRLIHFPPVCLDYVMVHEYVHMLEGSHSKRFWNLVEYYMPGYRAAEKLLKQ